MAEYIERERLVKHYENCIDEVKNTNGIAEDFEICLKALKAQPAADVVEVVRCKDCKYFMKDIEIEKTPYGFENEICTYGCERLFELSGEWIDVMVDDFCSYGERKEK